MPEIRTWIDAFRLRTLPLALSSIIMGGFLAVNNGQYDLMVITLAVVTTLLLQILSNLANDYGDAIKGTDNKDRLGPERTVQSGAITPVAMRKAMTVFVMLSLISGVSLILLAFKEQWVYALLLLVLGLAAIAASIKYTVGKTAYGYAGYGDLFVLIFFGFVGVLGTYFLNTFTFHWEVLLPALSMGLFSTAVLNLNNMRDLKNDMASGKHTLASRLGFANAKKYHIALVVGGILSAMAYTGLSFENYWDGLYILIIPFFFLDLRGILRNTNEALLDPFLKKQAIKTLFFAILFGVGLVL